MHRHRGFIILFGTRSIQGTDPVPPVRTVCPSCHQNADIVGRSYRQWFTLFFIPIFPISKVLGEQVKCDTCGTAFKPEVLQTPTSSQLSTHIRNALRVATVAIVATGEAGDPAMRSAAIDTIRGGGVADYDDATLASDLGHCDPARLGEYFPPLATGLSEPGKEAFITQLTQVAIAGGDLTRPQCHVLEAVGAGLQVTAAHLEGIVVRARRSGVSPPLG